MVWDEAGDTSEDYNRYSKRGLLAAVIPPVVMYWLDAPAGEESLDAIIQRTLNQQFGIAIMKEQHPTTIPYRASP